MIFLLLRFYKIEYNNSSTIITIINFTKIMQRGRKKMELGASITEKLIAAVIKNNTRAVKELLQKGADPNGYLDLAKLRPLHFAAQNNSLEAAELLIAAGADVGARSEPDKDLPIKIAILHKNKKIFNLLQRCITVNDYSEEKELFHDE
jgi:hypothetical protein